MRLTGNRCLCRPCGEVFNSDAAFDKHRAGSHSKQTRHCLDPSEIGMELNEAGFWVTERMPVRSEPKWAVLASGKHEKRDFGGNPDAGMSEGEKAGNRRTGVFSG